MKLLTRRAMTALAGLLALLSMERAAFADATRLATIGEVVPAMTTIRLAVLAEPLVATAPTSVEEDLALAQALMAHDRRQNADGLGHLEDFAVRHPSSGWAPAVLTNLGLSYLNQGYFSKALDAWQKAWRQGKASTMPEGKALIDRAVGELALLYASLGKMTELAALFDEIGPRAVTGSATERVQVAREMLALVDKEAHHLFTCGPLALQSLMLARGTAADQVTFLQWYRVGSDGTNLAQLAGLADKAKLGYRLIHRQPGQDVPVPSLVHLKVGHFAAIVGETDRLFHIEDAAIEGRHLWMRKPAIETEASGYFLVAHDLPMRDGWRSVELAEAARVWGKGNTTNTEKGAPGDKKSNSPKAGDPGAEDPDEDDPEAMDRGDESRDDKDQGDREGKDPKKCASPMCTYAIKESSVSLYLSDVPVGYTPAIGPSAKVEISYNQREDSQPANFNFYNVGQKWTINWISYVTDDPVNAGANVSRYLSGGGSYSYKGYVSATGRFANQTDDGSILTRVSSAPIQYKRQRQDGSVEIYSVSDGAISFPRNVFLSQIVDPQGNALTLNYDGQRRVTSVTDAVGRQTTLTYGLAIRPLLVTQITDPFGRNAKLTYDTSGRLSSITDVIGLTSSFTYDVNGLVNSMTTPYGTTTFAYTAPGTAAPPRFVEVTDPMGFHEREEWLEPSTGIPNIDPAATVPTGMPIAVVNNYLQYRNSFHWDKNAYVAAGCTPTGGCDYTKARVRHFTHVPPNTQIKAMSLESVKYPLENRVWYVQPGSASSVYGGTYNLPTAVGRVLDDGTTQLYRYAYDTTGLFKRTQIIDPLGRVTTFNYANGVDLVSITRATSPEQNPAGNTSTTIAQYVYDYRHRPIIYYDAAGQKTTYDYNAAGQLTSVTNPLNQTTQYQYDASYNLLTIINANSVTAATYTYDSFARVRTYTDSEGWTVTYDYDAADRTTKVTYPDGTFETYTYDRLDIVAYTDRQFRTWTYVYDANRRQTSATDPSGLQTQYAYNRNGQVTSLTDPRSNVTTWTYDVQGRLTGKQYPNTTTVTYTYENTTSRLKSITDALSQVKTYSYARDNRLAAITYTNAVNATPNVSFTWDVFFPRLVSRTDGIGTTQFAYVPVGSLGALRVQQESGPFADSAITSAYDELGRVASRTVQGAGAETFQYDAIGRLTGHTSDLGTFTLGYLGQTGQITSRQLASSTLATTWSYLTNTNDRRLAGINNVGLVSGHFSNFAYSTTPENLISSITETSDATAVYPSVSSQTATYNNLNQLTNLSGQALTYDAVGNLTSDGQRTYTWDAENRLVLITYPAQPGKQTAFAYDGFGRRRTIVSTPPGGGGATTTAYLWCGEGICQSRDGSNTPIRSYYDEGEYVPGTPASLYYGIDQIGSVRRVFASPTSAPAYGYDPFGLPLQVTAPITDFVYGGMFYNADSGLYLTNYRAYEPVAGRWLSRDPLGELTDLTANLYAYVGGNPVLYSDPLGLAPIPDPNGVVPGGPWSPAGPGQRPGSFFGPRKPTGGRDMCTWVPPGGPNNSIGYWKAKTPSGQWQYFDSQGRPTTPPQAHPGRRGGGSGSGGPGPGPSGGGSGGGGPPSGPVGGPGLRGQLWK
jgi:RHS repeat-associated protein